MPASLGATLATTVRMIDRIHGRTADVRTNSQPPRPTGFSQSHFHVLGISNCTDRGPTGGRHPPNFSRGQRELRPAGLTSDKHCR